MKNFRSLKSNCPICSGARRKHDCRENTSNGLIHCRYEVIGAPLNFRFVGVDSIGFNMWAADDGRERDSSQWEAQRQQRAVERERRLAANAERYAQSLDVDERDRNIKKIHAQLGLSTQHRQNLRDRGLTDTQIEAGKFFSIDPWQEVTAINPRLAGVDLYGRKLLIGQSGFACPVYDLQGRVIGWQTRFDDATDNKYRWTTSRSTKRPNGGTAHLQNGELPISCCRPVSIERNSIGLAEGFLKPYITSQRWGQVVIGAAGGNFTGSPRQLKAYLEALSLELKTKTVVLYPDAGAVANNSTMGFYERAIQTISEWGYTVRVAWWGQLVKKEQPDIDELPNLDSVTYLTPEEFLKLGGSDRRSTHNFTGLLSWLPRLAHHLQKGQRSPWGFGKKGEVELERSPATPEVLEYNEGDRRETWRAAVSNGYRHILDTSATGTGKSYDAGELTPELFGVRQIIYVSAEHRNPTTPTLKGWHDLEPRHKGQYRDEFGRLRRVDKGQPYVVKPNCGRNEVIAALRSKNIAGADTSELICKTCPHFEPCRADKVFGYLNQRAETLKQPLIRAHPASLMNPEEYDYENAVLIWEEAGESIKAHRSVEVKSADIKDAITALLDKLPDAFDSLRPLLVTLQRHINGEIKQPNKYGWNDAQIRQALPEINDINIDAIRTALTPDPRPLINYTQEHGVDAAVLPRNVRKMVAPSDKTTAEQIARELGLNWLPDFLDVLLGNTVGSLRIQYGVLTLTLSDERLAEIAKAAKCNFHLDATASPEDITRPLRVTDDKQLLVTQQVTQDVNNLEVIQVQMGQRLGISSRRKNDKGDDTFLQKRLNALLDQIQVDNPNSKVAVSDFKRHTKQGDGKRHHWVDTRGVNDLEDCDVLVLVGVMCRSLADLEAEFTILYGRPPIAGTERIKHPIQINGDMLTDHQRYFETDESADPEFRDFVRRRILADTKQAIGRLRAHRRSNKKLKVYILGDYAFDFPVTLVKAGDLTPNAATKKERKLATMVSAVKGILADGQKLTQKAVAVAVGCAQQLVSRYWSLLQTLLDDSYSKSSKNSEPPPDPDDIDWTGKQFLPLLAEQPPDELLNGVLNTFESHGEAIFRRIWDVTPSAAQIKILETLLLTLPAGEFRQLQSALEVCF